MTQNVAYFARNGLPQKAKERFSQKRKKSPKSPPHKKIAKILEFPTVKNYEKIPEQTRKKPVKYEGQTFHHLIPKSRGGERNAKNGLYLWEKRHRWWHTLFGVMTPNEIIEYLKRSMRFSLEEIVPIQQTKTWEKLFGNKSLIEVIKIIARILRMKKKGMIRKKHLVKFLRRKAA